MLCNSWYLGREIALFQLFSLFGASGNVSEIPSSFKKLDRRATSHSNVGLLYDPHSYDIMLFDIQPLH